MISVVILKPTRDCNADCSYCSAPPDNEPRWTIETFKTIFDRLEPNLSDVCNFIWHGGEPMLMGPEFYQKAWDYAHARKPNLKFSMQSNILLYKSSRWKELFHNVFEGSISTSFEPDGQSRTIHGNAQKYTKQFNRKIKEMVNDGFFPLVIGTYTRETAPLAYNMYDYANRLSHDTSKGGFDIRVNYMYPAGRIENESSCITPEQYGDLLIGLYDKWIKEVPRFDVVPLSEMFRKAIGQELVNKCPWTAKCGGKFLAVEPNGDLYNCSEFADLNDPSFAYGNILDGTVFGSKKEKIVGFSRPVKEMSNYSVEILKTPAARDHIRREMKLPKSCRSCHHFRECEGGCHRDSVLFERGMGGKFYYCHSWYVVFDRIKASVMSGEADEMIKAQGWDIDKARLYVESGLPEHGIIAKG